MNVSFLFAKEWQIHSEYLNVNSPALSNITQNRLQSHRLLFDWWQRNIYLFRDSINKGKCLSAIHWKNIEQMNINVTTTDSDEMLQSGSDSKGSVTCKTQQKNISYSQLLSASGSANVWQQNFKCQRIFLARGQTTVCNNCKIINKRDTTTAKEMIHFIWQVKS